MEHIWDDVNDECSCGCNPYDPCNKKGCIHCDLPENNHMRGE